MWLTLGHKLAITQMWATLALGVLNYKSHETLQHPECLKHDGICSLTTIGERGDSVISSHGGIWGERVNVTRFWGAVYELAMFAAFAVLCSDLLLPTICNGRSDGSLAPHEPPFKGLHLPLPGGCVLPSGGTRGGEASFTHHALCSSDILGVLCTLKCLHHGKHV